MENEQLLRLKALFSNLLDLESAARDEFMRRSASAATQRALRELLEADAELASMTAQRAVHLGPRSGMRTQRSVPGSIGEFVIDRELGRGGMGTVYLARHLVPGGTRLVALKLLHTLGTDDDFERRFHSEVAVLARLVHPHIARLIDAGKEADGTCWIAMEYIEGVPLLQYCAERRLPIAPRLALFETLCTAVGAAHRNLVVHRDIKSNNVLVRGDGELFLIDFGIARELGTPNDVTRPEHRFFSPLNAAPEQLRGEPTTTACDVYGLGVLLYELLSGCAPIEPARRSGEAVREAVLNEVPVPAAARIHQLARSDLDKAAHIAQERGEGDSSRLARALQGDLETVCSVALRKRPEERYASVDNLREDLIRARSGRPVMARGSDRLYRFSRWLRRHALAVSVAVLAFAAALIGVTLLWLQGRVLERERDTARMQTALAQQQKGRAEFVSTFLLDAFEQADPTYKTGRTLTAGQILLAGAHQLRSMPNGDPQTQVQIGDTIIDVLYRLSFDQEGEELLAYTRQRLSEIPHPPANLLAQQHYVESLRLAHELNWDQALAEVDAGLAILGTPDDDASQRLWLRLRHKRADLLTAKDDKVGRKKVLRDTIALLPSMPGIPSTDAWRIRVRLAQDLNIDAETRPEARTILTQILKEESAAGITGSVVYANALAGMAVVELRDNHAHLARGYDEQVLAVTRSFYGENAVMTARALNNLAGAEIQDHDTKLAVTHLENAAAVFERNDLPESLVKVHFNIAEAYHTLHEHAKAEQYYHLAIDGWARTLGSHHTNTVIAKTNLAIDLIEQDRFREADPLLAEALQHYQAIGGTEEDISQVQVAIALVQHAKGHGMKATELLQKWLVIYRKYVQPDDPIRVPAERLAKKLHLA